MYYFLNDKEIDKKWMEIYLSGNKVSDLIKCREKIDLCFDGTSIDSIERSNENMFIDNNFDADTYCRILLKLNRGIIINNIYETKSNYGHLQGDKRKVRIYSIKILEKISLSSISHEAISFLSSKKLSKGRARYWLPCGENQMQEISINFDQYRKTWIHPLTDFFQFFKYGIILRSTWKELDKDMATLVNTVKKYKKEITANEIEQKLREFYEKYPFESRDDEKLFS